MITSAHEKVIWVTDFPRQKAHDDLDWERSSVYEISIK